METVVGNVEVANKSYDIQGNVVDSTGDTPIDVNALQGVQGITEGQRYAPSSFTYSAGNERTGGGATTPEQENPNQTFLPRA